jgi:hydrogenase-4 component B
VTPGRYLLAAAVCSALALLFARRARRAWLVMTVAAAIAGVAACIHVFIATESWDWQVAMTPGGQAWHVRLDAVSALFLALLSLIGGLGAVWPGLLAG